MTIAILASTSGSDLPAVFKLKTEGIDFFLITNKPQCGALEKAKNAAVPTHIVEPTGKTREAFDEEILKILETEKADFVFLIGYMRIVTGVLITPWKRKIFNIHPSLLPAFAGGMDTDVHAEVLKRGCKITGATLHEVTEEVDSGPIVDQKSCRVEATDTPETLKHKVQKLEQEMLVDCIRNLQKSPLVSVAPF
ncbi:MAG: phosphoribosylglycinamide formyltransferase [Candidatus Peregrinibacteria bacterium]